MLDYKNYLIQRIYSLQKTLKSGDENEVLLVRRSDGTQFVLRVYSYEVPVYAALLGHNCIYLPAVYRFYAAEGLYFVEEEILLMVRNNYYSTKILHTMIETGRRL